MAEVGGGEWSTMAAAYPHVCDRTDIPAAEVAVEGVCVVECGLHKVEAQTCMRGDGQGASSAERWGEAARRAVTELHTRGEE